MEEYAKEDRLMRKKSGRIIWVAVRVQRGFVSDVRAYQTEKSARRLEKSWRRRMNPDYDEAVTLPAHVE